MLKQIFALSLLASLASVPAIAEEGDTPVGFRADPDAPIEIEADTLEVEQSSEKATFIGRVIAVQGPLRLTSDRLVVTYARNADSAPESSSDPDSGTKIERIRATGSVHVMSEDDQSADGDWAVYEVASSNITMGDSVVLRQGENVIRGKRLTIDLNSGQARVDGGVNATTGENGSSGRVRGLFQVPQD
jgi:lipopolysaccharide export system protein LptA